MIRANPFAHGDRPTPPPSAIRGGSGCSPSPPPRSSSARSRVSRGAPPRGRGRRTGSRSSGRASSAPSTASCARPRPSACSATDRPSSNACASPRDSRRAPPTARKLTAFASSPHDWPNSRWRRSGVELSRSGGVSRRRTDPLPARASTRGLRERVLLLRLGFGGSDRDPASLLHAFLVERSLDGTRGQVTPEFSRRVLLIEFHPFAFLGRAPGRDNRDPERAQRQRMPHSVALYPNGTSRSPSPPG